MSTALPSIAIDPVRARQKRRAWWLKQLHAWHWISAALSLVGMLLFAATGITLNHAADLPGTPVVVRDRGQLPQPLLDELRSTARQAIDDGSSRAMPATSRDWLAREFGLRIDDRAVEWSAEEVYVSLPRPGGDAWLSIDLASGIVERERTDRGVVSYLNDLHKGRNTGGVWSLFLDLFAVACLLFSATGLWLLQLHSKGRALTWPLVGLGLLVPVLLALLFIH